MFQGFEWSACIMFWNSFLALSRRLPWLLHLSFTLKQVKSAARTLTSSLYLFQTEMQEMLVVPVIVRKHMYFPYFMSLLKDGSTEETFLACICIWPPIMLSFWGSQFKGLPNTHGWMDTGFWADLTTRSLGNEYIFSLFLSFGTKNGVRVFHE